MITSNGLVQLGFDKDTDFVLQNNSDGSGTFIAEWLSDSAQPTQSAIEAAAVTWQTNYDAQEYARNRKTEYPSIGDQLDMIYHNGDGGATFQAAIKAVKDKYPKP